MYCSVCVMCMCPDPDRDGGPDGDQAGVCQSGPAWRDSLWGPGLQGVDNDTDKMMTILFVVFYYHTVQPVNKRKQQTK